MTIFSPSCLSLCASPLLIACLSSSCDFPVFSGARLLGGLFEKPLPHFQFDQSQVIYSLDRHQKPAPQFCPCSDPAALSTRMCCIRSRLSLISLSSAFDTSSSFPSRRPTRSLLASISLWCFVRSRERRCCSASILRKYLFLVAACFWRHKDFLLPSIDQALTAFRPCQLPHLLLANRWDQTNSAPHRGLALLYPRVASSSEYHVALFLDQRLSIFYCVLFG